MKSSATKACERCDGVARHLARTMTHATQHYLCDEHVKKYRDNRFILIENANPNNPNQTT